MALATSSQVPVNHLVTYDLNDSLCSKAFFKNVSLSGFRRLFVNVTHFM